LHLESTDVISDDSLYEHLYLAQSNSGLLDWRAVFGVCEQLHVFAYVQPTAGLIEVNFYAHGRLEYIILRGHVHCF
jgi:hypothetical protein